MTNAKANYEAARVAAQEAAKRAYPADGIPTDADRDAFDAAMEELARAEAALPKSGTYNGICDYLRAAA